MHHPTDRIAHTTAFVTPVVEHWLEREIEYVTKKNPLIFMPLSSTNSNSLLLNFGRASTYVVIADTAEWGLGGWEGIYPSLP